jgi:hypothetical protein
MTKTSPTISRLVALASAAATLAAANGHFMSDRRVKRNIRSLAD